MDKISYLQNFKGERYYAPRIDVVEFSVEQGFTISGTGSADWENGGEDNNIGDF